MRSNKTGLKTGASVAVTSTPVASELHLGAVGGHSEKLKKQFTTTNGTAYAVNDNLGGISNLTNLLRVALGTAVLQDVILWSKENQKPNLILDFWDSSPATGTYTNDAAQVIAGDETKWLGTVEIATTDWIDTGTISRAHIKSIGAVLYGASGRDIFMTIQTKTAITYTSVTGLYGRVGVLQD